MWIRGAARLIAMFLTGAVTIHALYLLVVGVRWVQVTAVGPGEALGPVRVGYRPYPLAVVPLAAAVLVAAGLWPRGRLGLAWIGVGILLVFAGLSVFSVGLALLPAAGLLLIALAVLTALVPQRNARRPT